MAEAFRLATFGLETLDERAPARPVSRLRGARRGGGARQTSVTAGTIMHAGFQSLLRIASSIKPATYKMLIAPDPAG
jgi:hypothetical protein